MGQSGRDLTNLRAVQVEVLEAAKLAYVVGNRLYRIPREPEPPQVLHLEDGRGDLPNTRLGEVERADARQPFQVFSRDVLRSPQIEPLDLGTVARPKLVQRGDGQARPLETRFPDVPFRSVLFGGFRHILVKQSRDEVVRLLQHHVVQLLRRQALDVGPELVGHDLRAGNVAAAHVQAQRAVQEKELLGLSRLLFRERDERLRASARLEFAGNELVQDFRGHLQHPWTRRLQRLLRWHCPRAERRAKTRHNHQSFHSLFPFSAFAAIQETDAAEASDKVFQKKVQPSISDSIAATIRATRLFVW